MVHDAYEGLGRLFNQISQREKRIQRLEERVALEEPSWKSQIRLCQCKYLPPQKNMAPDRVVGFSPYSRKVYD